jgi:hypothetical protein
LSPLEGGRLCSNVQFASRPDLRRASRVDTSAFNETMTKLNRSVKVLKDADSYQVFLESGAGWAVIEPTIAKTFMPQWLTARECRRIQIVVGTEIFVDKTVVREIILVTRALSIFGSEVEANDWADADRLLSNLLLSRCSVS